MPLAGWLHWVRLGKWNPSAAASAAPPANTSKQTHSGIQESNFQESTHISWPASSFFLQDMNSSLTQPSFLLLPQVVTEAGKCWNKHLRGLGEGNVNCVLAALLGGSLCCLSDPGWHPGAGWGELGLVVLLSTRAQQQGAHPCPIPGTHRHTGAELCCLQGLLATRLCHYWSRRREEAQSQAEGVNSALCSFKISRRFLGWY